MLVAPALVLVWELALCEGYEYEYAAGDAADAYDTYFEEQATLHARPDVGRVRRFGDSARPDRATTDPYDVGGAIMRILGERRQDGLKNITTPSPNYERNILMFTPLPDYLYTNIPTPTRSQPFMTTVPTRSTLHKTDTETETYTTETAIIDAKTFVSVKKPQLDERGLQTILDLTEDNLLFTQQIPEYTEGREEYTTPLYQITVAKETTEQNDITAKNINEGTHGTDVEENITFPYIIEALDVTRETILMQPTSEATGEIINTVKIPQGTEENNTQLTDIFTTLDSNTAKLVTAKIFTKKTTLVGMSRVRPQKTSWLTTDSEMKIKAEELEKAGVNFSAFSHDSKKLIDFSGDFPGRLLREQDDTTTAMAMTDNEPTTTEPTTTETTTTVATTTKISFDIEKFLEIIANLTYDYETNLTAQVNETLQKFSVPTCRTPTTTTTTAATTTPTTPPPPEYTALNRTIIAKCFVCGLEAPGIPYDADCADAFAGDFLPLVPQDPRAKGKIARFRKYCRYGEVHNYLYNASQPRSLFGRWTGGCSVRWTDLSGIYTQRSCRNRRRPTTGLHYASKRMAKLEAALSLVEQGCIVSPVATLLPLSRGISLFARFHACVCRGNWCNRAAGGAPSAALAALALPVALRAACW